MDLPRDPGEEPTDDDQTLPPPTHVLVGGLPATCITRQQAARYMVDDCIRARRLEAEQPKLVFTSNGQALSLAAADPAYRNLVFDADYVHADGASIVLASRLLTRRPIPERVATTDFIHDAARCAVEENLSFFLLGADEAVNLAAAEALKAAYPGLQIVGRRDGYFCEADEAAICEDINKSEADVVWVGLGQPKEQKFAVRNRARITSGWIITCGGCFNFLSGDYKRAPDWMQRLGLEWLHRMFTGPRYLIWRYLTTNPHALWLILTRTKRDPVELQREAD